MKTLASDYLFFLLFLSFKISISCPEVEKQSLLSFKQSLKDPSNLLYSWNNTEVNCCKWKCVICSNLTGHVHELHLQTSDLSGKINPSLLSLRYLKYLDLSQNNFEQTIFPSFIGSLTSLEYLNLSGAGFYGKIPYSIGNLSNLHTLVLEDNFLNVDSLKWLSGLSKLDHLNMNDVNLSKTTDSLEQVIYKLPSLVELRFSSCSLNDFASPMNDNIVNITHSSIAIIDLSDNNMIQSSDILRRIFQLSNLIFLDLRVNYFEGPIPSIANTTKLKHIDLSVNNFNSTIPEWLYSCIDLEFVSLSGNHLNYEISDSIRNLTSLNILDLSSNSLSGEIPRGIANLCRLQMLDLGDNKLHGDVSKTFGNMSGPLLISLESLYLCKNQLSGNLTHTFTEFTSLRTLDLTGNSLSGEIPNNIGSLSSLEYLSLCGNKLIGNLPESLGKLSNLISLGITDNMLDGVVSEIHFSHLSKLIYFYASRNNLVFNVSPNWVPPFKIEILQLGSWNLGSGARIPLWLGSQKDDILGLDLSCTGISGIVPNWIWNVRLLNLSHNKLHGSVPFISDPKDDYYGSGRLIYLSSNNFSGSLPRVSHIVTELDLSNNSFSGALSLFLCDKKTRNKAYGLRILDLGQNHLSGELPDCWTKWPFLTMLNLGDNNFSGTIPTSIGFLGNLESLNLFGNKLSGIIPFSMQNCTQLLKMDLADNDIDGNIPEWIGTSLSELKILILRSNKLSGEITSAICQLSSLQILDFSDNIFSGVIPRCVDNFTAMTTKRSWGALGYSYIFRAFLDEASVSTKGSILQYDTILPLVTSIDLSKNNLSGDIPNEITSLVELISLNLSRNHLTGSIPDSFGNMKQLESLDFSRNSLSGEIPSSFTAMTSLDYLNLSCNNLSGEIPLSTQLRDFNSSSFTGNNLCGPPLTNSCNNKGDGREHENDEGDESEIEWVYVFVSLGYSVGLSGFLTTLYFLKSSWRYAYHEFLEDIWDTLYLYFYFKWRMFKRAFG